MTVIQSLTQHFALEKKTVFSFCSLTKAFDVVTLGKKKKKQGLSSYFRDVHVWFHSNRFKAENSLKIKQTRFFFLYQMVFLLSFCLVVQLQISNLYKCNFSIIIFTLKDQKKKSMILPWNYILVKTPTLSTRWTYCIVGKLTWVLDLGGSNIALNSGWLRREQVSETFPKANKSQTLP